MFWTPKVFSQGDTVRIPLERANLIIDDLKELDALRVSDNLNNMLIKILERDRNQLQELLRQERIRIELLENSRGIPAPVEPERTWAGRALADLQKYLIGFGLGALLLLFVR